MLRRQNVVERFPLLDGIWRTKLIGDAEVDDMEAAFEESAMSGAGLWPKNSPCQTQGRPSAACFGVTTEPTLTDGELEP